MDSHRRRALVAGGLFIGLAVFYYRLADDLPGGVLFEQIGSDVTPKLLAVTIAGLAALLVAADLLAPTRPTDGEAEPENGAAFRGTLAVMAITTPLWSAIGFLAAPAVMAGTMVVNGTRSPRTVLVVSAVGTAVLYLVFFRLFGQEVPLGMLGG